MTAVGINNNGELVFPYGKEDSDYNIDGNPNSGYVFNGATSVFWCRLRDLFTSEINSTFGTVLAECFSSTNLINQFDEYQSCYPEEIWRLDVERKYIRTFSGLSVDNSKPKHDAQYLRDMMQGRKKYHRRQWERDQEMYFGTKHLMNSVVGDNNRITFRCFTPTGNVAIAPDYTLRIVPFSDMYVSVMFGNGDVRQVRAKAGQEYTILCPLATMDDTQVTIYGADHIQALSDLSACYIAANNFSMATKLKKLVLGNANSSYNNSRLVSLTLGSNKLLEELDIRNCGQLTGSLALGECPNLKVLLAEGTKIASVVFATNGRVETAHLPNTIDSLVMRNLNNLSDFQATLNLLTNLTLEGGTLNNLQLIQNTIDTLNVLNLYGIDWTLSNTDLMNQIRALFYSLLTGKVTISGPIRNSELNAYASLWPDLEVIYDSSMIVTQYVATYTDWNGNVLYETYLDQGSTPPDPVALGYISQPSRSPDAQYLYTYNGWDDITSPMLADRTITVAYSTTIRTYTVKWYALEGDTTPLATITDVSYGSEVVYPNADLPTNTSEESTYIYNVFKGWDKNTGFVKSDLNVYAVWDRASLPPSTKDLKDMSPAEISAVVKSGNVGSYFEIKDYFEFQMGHDFYFKQSDTESVVFANDITLDGNTYIDTGIKLFGPNDRSFTIAIDYRFADTTFNNTLLSAFEPDGQEGFRLRYNSGPNVQWCNTNQTVGYQKFREMLVLRHIKGEKYLYMYAFNENTTDFSASIKKYIIQANRVTTTELSLGLGAINFLEDGGKDDYGTGYIYWGKIWYEDLGDANCQKLAAWTRETLRMEYYGTGRYRLTGGGSQKCSASFISNSTFTDRRIQMNSTNTNAGGWDACAARSIANGKMYNGIPDAYRSLIKQVKIPATEGNQSTSVLLSDDYVYFPSYIEMQNTTDANYTGEGSFITWFTSNSVRAKYMGFIVPENATIYDNQTNSDPCNDVMNPPKFGDIWKRSDNTYYYFGSPDTLAKIGCAGTPVLAGDNTNYWIPACTFWLRSPSVGYTTYFWLVDSGGYTYGGYGASGSFSGAALFSF